MKLFASALLNDNISNEIKEKAINDYKRLNSLINSFLKTQLQRNERGNATIFGFELGDAKLSDGQIILIQFCLAIYSQEHVLKDLILILDEPENHIHPSILLSTLDKIIECVPNGQIWIATHSIPLLAHFDTDCIWFVDEGKVRHAGKIPEKVLYPSE